MTRLLVLVEGRNYRTNFGEGELSIGFLANRFVDAADEKSIDEDRLFRRVAAELAETNVSSTPTSTMWISRVSVAPNGNSTEVSGFSFYPQDSVFRRWLRWFSRRQNGH